MALIAVPVLATFLLVLGAYAGGLSIVWIGLIAIIAVPALVAALLIFDQLIPR